MKLEKTVAAVVHQISEDMGFEGDIFHLDVSEFVPEKAGLIMDPQAFDDCLSTLAVHSKQQYMEVTKVLVSPSDYKSMQDGVLRSLVTPDDEGRLVLFGIPIEASELVPENFAIALPKDPFDTVYSVDWGY